MKDAPDRDLTVSGPGLAQHAFVAGLVPGFRSGTVGRSLVTASSLTTNPMRIGGRPACGDRWLDFDVSRRLDEILTGLLASDGEIITRHFDTHHQTAP